MSLYRNPGGSELGPWCFVENNLGTTEKSIEHCGIPKCSDKMWLYIIIAFVSIATLVIITITIICCKKYRKRGMTNIQNVRKKKNRIFLKLFSQVIKNFLDKFTKC